ncbi:MAG: hypothetical protein ACOY0R_13515 [Chloroflexota bacterium]
METPLEANWTVGQVMQVHPRSMAGFLALKTACVGCHLVWFCTLTEVAAAYQMPLTVLLETLKEGIQTSTEQEEKP